MELVYDMLLPAFTGIMVSFLVAKLVAMALRCEQVSVGDNFNGVDSLALLEENYESDNRLSVESSVRASNLNTTTGSFPKQQDEESEAELLIPAAAENSGVLVIELESADSGDELTAQLAELPVKQTLSVDSVDAQTNTVSFRKTEYVADDLGCPDSDVTEEKLDSGLDSSEQTLQFRSYEVSSLTQGILDTEVGFLNDQGVNESDKVVEHELVGSELPRCGYSEMEGLGTAISNQDNKLESEEDAGKLGILTAHGLEIGNLISGEDEDKVNKDGSQAVDDYDTAPRLKSLNNDNVVADHLEQEVVSEIVGIKTEEKNPVVDDQDYGFRVLKVAEEETCGMREEGGNGIDLEINSDDAEEWEGIERSDLERDFARAVNFVQCGGGDTDGLVSNDVIMQLYGFQKIAMEGPCHESAPMALKLTARAKWNVWNDLGSMSPEEAMERYISILSDKVPGWMDGQIAVKEGIASTSKASADNCKENTSLSSIVGSNPDTESLSVKDELPGSASITKPDH